jgi:hypothetical protein
MLSIWDQAGFLWTLAEKLGSPYFLIDGLNDNARINVCEPLGGG